MQARACACVYVLMRIIPCRVWNSSALLVNLLALLWHLISCVVIFLSCVLVNVRCDSGYTVWQGYGVYQLSFRFHVDTWVFEQWGELTSYLYLSDTPSIFTNSPPTIYFNSGFCLIFELLKQLSGLGHLVIFIVYVSDMLIFTLYFSHVARSVKRFCKFSFSFFAHALIVRGQ